jgi:hypothetical protein
MVSVITVAMTNRSIVVIAMTEFQITRVSSTSYRLFYHTAAVGSNRRRPKVRPNSAHFHADGHYSARHATGLPVADIRRSSTGGCAWTHRLLCCSRDD